MRSLPAYASELVGTYLHILAGTFAVALGFAPASPLVAAVPDVMTRRLVVGLLFVGSAILVALSPLGRRSGGHLNPAVSVGFWLHGRLPGRTAATYVLAQCAGALGAAATAAALAPGTVRDVGYAVTRPRVGLPLVAAAGVEAAESCLLLLVIFTLVCSVRAMRWTPLAVWLLITSYVWLLAPLTGASVNPARSLGPAVVAGTLPGYWPYAVGPLGGAVLAAALWRLLRLRPAVTMHLCPPAPVPAARRADVAEPLRPATSPATISARGR